MASADGSISMQEASDEIFVNFCGPCKEDNIEKGANQYCVDCGVYLCNQCKDFHRKLPLSKNHKVVFDGQNLTAVSPVSQGSDPGLYCSCNTNKEVEFYCKNHKDIMCNPCRSTKHHKCKTVSVQEKSSSYTTQMFKSLTLKIKSMKDKFYKMKKESTEAINELTLSKEACKEEIQTFRKELSTFLDKLENDMLKDLDKTEKEQHKQLNQHISTLTATLQMLDSDYTLLENAKEDGRKSMMFTSDLQVSKRLQDYESTLKDFEKVLLKPALVFKRNKHFDYFQTFITVFGKLRVKVNNSTSLKKKLLLGSKIRSRRKVQVKSDNDQNSPGITGCTVLSSGHIVLCDYNNNNLKLLNTTSILQGTLTLPNEPRDVSAVDDNNVIVTLPWKMQLQYAQVLPQMKAGRFIQLDKKCWGVMVSGDEIYTTCHDNPGQGEVRILGLNGTIKRRLGIKQDGSFMFVSPYYITVSQSGRKIFISDYHTSSVTSMTGDGNSYYQYTHDGLKSPLGLLVDAGDNVLVCAQSSCTVQLIAIDGSKHETLLSSRDLPQLPSFVAYRVSDDTLVVGCWYHYKVFLFQLAK